MVPSWRKAPDCDLLLFFPFSSGSQGIRKPDSECTEVSGEIGSKPPSFNQPEPLIVVPYTNLKPKLKADLVPNLGPNEG